MKLPVNYADVRMEQLLQRTQTSYEMVKDEESRRRIIELQLFVLDVIQALIKEKNQGILRNLNLNLHIEEPSGGYSKTVTYS